MSKIQRRSSQPQIKSVSSGVAVLQPPKSDPGIVRLGRWLRNLVPSRSNGKGNGASQQVQVQRSPELQRQQPLTERPMVVTGPVEEPPMQPIPQPAEKSKVVSRPQILSVDMVGDSKTFIGRSGLNYKIIFMGENVRNQSYVFRIVNAVDPTRFRQMIEVPFSGQAVEYHFPDFSISLMYFKSNKVSMQIYWQK